VYEALERSELIEGIGVDAFYSVPGDAVPPQA